MWWRNRAWKQLEQLQLFERWMMINIVECCYYKLYILEFLSMKTNHYVQCGHIIPMGWWQVINNCNNVKMTFWLSRTFMLSHILDSYLYIIKWILLLQHSQKSQNVLLIKYMSNLHCGNEHMCHQHAYENTIIKI